MHRPPQSIWHHARLPSRLLSPRPSSPDSDIIRVRPVRSAFKDELAIVIDDHGEAVTIEAVVFTANEAVVFEANEVVIFKANEAVVFEANRAIVLEANEAVVLEANKAVVFEV